MAFKLWRDTYQYKTKFQLLNNSLTVKVGDALIPLTTDSSILTNATAAVAGAKYPLGIVIGFCKSNGEVITTGTDPLNTPAQLVTASDNTTVSKYCAVFIPINNEQEWEADGSAAFGTTTASDKPWVWFNLATAATVDESSILVVEDGSAPLQLLSLGLSPNNSSTTPKVIVKFAKALLTRP